MANLMALRQDAADELGGLLDSFQSGADRAALLRDGERVLLLLHVIAAATLLVDGNPQGFFLNLCRMAENQRRLTALLLSRRELPPPARKNAGLLAALAAGDFKLADALATISGTPPQPEDYEDEHLWATILQHFARLVPLPAAATESLVGRLEALGSKELGSRCAIARALLAGNARDFAEAFEVARLEYEEITEKRAADFTTPVTAFAPHRFLWLEGLALLRLAERAGIAPAEMELRYCPALARLPMTEKYAGDWTIPGQPLP